MHIAQSLDVLDDGRLAEEARYLREWGLCARMRPFALQSVQQSGFFTTDIPARTDVQVQFKVEAGPENIRSEIPALFCLSQSKGEPLRRAPVFASQENVPDLSLNGIRGDSHALDELVRIALHQNAVFESARLHLVRIRPQVFRPWRIRTHGHEAPLHCRRKAGPSPPAQIRTLHQVRYVLRLHLERFAKAFVSACAFVGDEIHSFSVRTKIFGEGFLHGA